MKKMYDLLLVGATALSAGVISAHPELSIAVLEQSCSVAGEFANTYQTDNAYGYSPRTSQGKRLREQFLKRNALSAEGEWLPAVMPILSEGLCSSRADVYFFAAVTNISGEDGCYRVQWNAFGIAHSFRARRIVDTTAKFLCGAYFPGEPPRYTMALNHMDIAHRIHSTPCDDPAKGRFAVLEQHRDILRIAAEPTVVPQEQKRQFGAAAWIPSAARGNFLAAFDAGAEVALPEGACSAAAPEPVYDGNYDVIVVGLGTAGAMAAITASGEGLKVLGIENLSICGGAGTAGNVAGYYYGYKGGVYRAVDERSHRFDDRFIPMNRVGVDQKVAQLYAELSQCDVRLNAIFTEALRQETTVNGVVWYENGIRHSAHARFVIDATAEAAVCVSAGCEMLGGRASDGRFQPYSCVHLKHVDGKLLAANMDQGRMDQYDPDSLGPGILQSYASYLHLREDYGSREYLGIVPLFGLREGLRIRGEETVAFGDVVQGRFCEKPVYWCWSNFDNHGKDNALESEHYQDWVTLCGMWGWGLSVPVPMGALIPKGYDGLLAAGRCVSVDHDTAFAVRMKDDVQKSGEVAARIAALAIGGGVCAKAVDLDSLRSCLFATGCLKPEDEIPRIEKQKFNELYEGQLWCEDDEAITRGLASDSPGYFMWSARVLERKELLTRLLEHPEENVRFHGAMALAMLPEVPEKAVEQLCCCARKQDGYISQSGRKYVYPRSVAAIYALGRAGSEAAVDTLYQLLEDTGFVAELPFTPDLLLADREDYAFQYRSHLICALCRIAMANPERKTEICSRLTAWMKGKQLSVSLIGGTLRFDVTDTLSHMVQLLNSTEFQFT